MVAKRQNKMVQTEIKDENGELEQLSLGLGTDDLNPNQGEAIDLEMDGDDDESEEEKSVLEEIEVGDFIILFNEIMQNAASYISSLESMLTKIESLIVAHYSITYLTDGENNLGFRFVRNGSVGYKKDAPKGSSLVNSLLEDNDNASMFPIDKGQFMILWTNLKEGAIAAIQRLESMQVMINTYLNEEYDVQYFNDQFGNLHYVAKPKKPMGFDTSRTKQKS